MTASSEQAPPPTPPPPPEDKRDAKARAKADKAYKKASRPWYKKKRFIFTLALVAIVVIIVASNSGGGSGDNTAATDQSDSSADNGGGDSQDTNPYADKYGTFKAINKQGSGASTMPLPKGASAAIVAMTHKGSSNFSVTTLDASNQPTGDLLANTIGGFSGTAAYGLNDIGEPTKLQVTADGDWTIKITPISSAKQLPESAAGKGDLVYLYDGDAADWAIQHTGSSNFSVAQYTESLPNLMVNEIGNYKGTVPAVDGPSVVTITADGKWTIKAK